MITSIISHGVVTTPKLLAQEIVFQHGHYSVIGFKSILESNGLKLTHKQREAVIEQVLNQLTRQATIFFKPCETIKFDAASAEAAINNQFKEE